MPPKDFYEIDPAAYIFKAKFEASETGGKWIAKPEEKVRQWVLYELFRTYGYHVNHIKIEQRVIVGTRNHFADIVIFKEEKPFIVIECKRRKDNKIEKGVDQAISYASSKNIRAEYAVFTNGNKWIVNRFINNEWVRIPDIPSKKAGQYLNELEPFILELQDILPLLYWWNRAVPAKQAKDFFLCLQNVFNGHSLLLTGIDGKIQFATDLILRVLYGLNSHEQYVHGKISGVFKEISAYLKQIDPDSHEDFHTSESNIRELVLSCRRRLSNLAGDAMNIANENINTIRFDLALLDYYLKSFNKKKYSDITQEVMNEFKTLFELLINKNLGFGFQDSLLAENKTELWGIYEQEWEKFKNSSK